jgi:hypothetical protein
MKSNVFKIVVPFLGLCASLAMAQAPAPPTPAATPALSISSSPAANSNRLHPQNPIAAPKSNSSLMDSLLTPAALSLVVSSVAFVLSLFVAYRAWSFNEVSTRRASRETHMKMLFDVGQILVTTPDLWTVYDSHSLALQRDSSPLGVARRAAFIYQHLNIFDLVWDYYNNLIKRDRVDAEYWKAWDNYIRQFFRESSEARLLFAESRTQEIYSQGFVAYINKLVADVRPTMPPAATPPQARTTTQSNEVA